MKKIASIEKIVEVCDHPNADRLDLIKVLGYQCVTQKGLHKTGDTIIYIQPDSILPEQPWAEGYRVYSPSRIKAVKLRGEYSEGIIVRLEQVAEFLPADGDIQEGDDMAAILGVEHYEPPAPQDLSAKGLLPFGIPKTDEERWENIVSVLPIGETVDVTLKVDGQSWSAYYKLDQDAFGVLGRTMEYKLECGNRYTAQIARYGIEEKLRAFGQKHNVSICIRGESYGEGLQNFAHNPHAKEKAGLALFSVYLIDERRYARKGDPFYFDIVAAELDLPTVEFIERDVVLTEELIQKYSVGIDKINGKPFEGVVVNHGAYVKPKTIQTPDGDKVVDYTYSPGSFKIINKNYDSKK